MIELLTDKTAKEKANIKATEIAKLDLSEKYTDSIYGITLEIQSVEKIERGIQVLVKAWSGENQLGFGDGTVEIERINIFNPPILVADSQGTIQRVGISGVDGTEQVHKYREDPIEAVKQSLTHTIKVIAKDGSKIIKGKVGNTTSTFYPDPAPESTSVDGTVNDQDTLGAGVNWATKIAAAGTGAFDTGPTGDSENEAICFRITSDNVSDKWLNLSRSIDLFDTSTLPDTDNIDSGTISFVGSAKVDNLSITPNANIYSSAPASNTALAAGDFDSLGTTALATAITYANLTSDSSTYTDFTLNATGLAAISKTGVSKFGVRNANYDVAGVAPTWSTVASSTWYVMYADAATTATDPKLVVVHSAAGGGAKNLTLLGVGT